MDALAAADDLAIAFGREHVDAQRDLGALAVGLEVEGLDLGGIPIHHQRAGRDPRVISVSSVLPKSPPHWISLPFSFSFSTASS